MKPLIIIPTYNEKENITAVINAIQKVRPGIHVLVVDDNSPDGTRDLVKKIAACNTAVHLLERPGKSGIGPAYIAGFEWGLSRGYDVLIEMDADFSHSPDYIPVFLDKIEAADVVIGSRWMKGGGIRDWPLARLLLSRWANIYSGLVLRVPIRDLTGGFTCWRREVLEAIPLGEVHSDGYCFQIEMKYRAYEKNFKIVEIPIIFSDRVHGKSKISRQIVLEAFFKVWLLKFSRDLS